MEVTPANFVIAFFSFCFTAFFTFLFVCAFSVWIVSKILGARVGFRVGGCNRIRDIVVRFNKGAVESVYVSEIKIILRHSLVEHVAGVSSLDPKLQLSICKLEVVTRPSIKSPAKKKTQKSRARSSSKGKGKGKGNKKWIMISNIAKYLSVCVTDIVLKTPKFALEIRELNVDISKDQGSETKLFVRVNILPIGVRIHGPQMGDQLSNPTRKGYIAPNQASATAAEKSSGSFMCEKFNVSCEFDHNSEVGTIIKNVDISIGEIMVNLNEGILVKKKSSLESHSTPDISTTPSEDSISIQEPLSKQQKLAANISKFPEKVSFNLPKVDVKFTHREHGILVENSITSIQLNINKFRSIEDVGEITQVDVQLVFTEIHLLREAGSSMLEISKLDLIFFVYVPVQSLSPIRAEIEINLEGFQCNILTNRLRHWLLLHLSKKKRMVLQEDSSVVKPKPKPKTKSTDKMAIKWKCTVSVPEVTIMLFDMAGSPAYYGCLQSSHLVANNISHMGTTVHFELGEINLSLDDEYKKCLEESFLGMETNSGSIMQITKVSLDWDKMDTKSSEEDSSKGMQSLSVTINNVRVVVSVKRVEPLIAVAMPLQALLKSLSASKKKSTQITKPPPPKPPSGKGAKLVKCNLEQCSLYIFGETELENAVIPDPKRVNYGSQGGRIVITESADGTLRTASVMSNSEYPKLKYSISLEIVHTKLCLNKEKQSTQIELERTRSNYEEYIEENDRPVTKVALFDMQNAKFLQRSGGVKENSTRSLFSVTDITVRWEPDLQISLMDFVLRLKSVMHNSKLQEQGNENVEDLSKAKDAPIPEPRHVEKKKKKEQIFAVDVEMLNISAGLGDGVEATVKVQSIFSENARIGVLLEGLMFGFNGARIIKSSRMQISRIPSKSISSSIGPTLDWVIQGLDIQICMPYRLQLRAIDDALEDMLRALKLIIAAKTSIIFPVKKESSKVKKPSSGVKFGCLKLFIRKLTFDIEEEPIQGWLDEHYHLLKREVGELAVRMNFLDEFVSKANQGSKSNNDDTTTVNSSQGKNVDGNDIEVNASDSSTINSMREEIYKQSFQQYYQACQSLVLSEGSGAYKDAGFQVGFKPSASRISLLTLSASDLDVTLTKIDGGEDGMIELLKKLDPIILKHNIPFSRMFGANIVLRTASLVAQIRDYTYPLFSGSSGRCEGSVVLAQQATFFQPQMLQDVYVGKWRKVSMLRSLTGTTPPMKSYLNLPIHFQKGEVSFGVGYEPVFADISYAFTVVMRRANLSVIKPGPLILPPKKEKSLPWWDDMRNYIHGKVSLTLSETKFHLLATSNPYEKLDKLEIVTSSMEIHQSDGKIYASAKDFKVLVSSLENLASKQGSEIPAGVSGAFLEAPFFILDVRMDWDCDSGDPMNHFLFALPAEGKTREKVFDPFRSTNWSLRMDIYFSSFLPSFEKQSSSSMAGTNTRPSHNVSPAYTIIKLGAHDLAWLVKFGNVMYLPPHKLRLFSRFPRFGVPRILRSGNLAMDKVMTEFMIRIDSTPTCIKNIPFHDDDLAKGLTLTMNKMKFEVCFSRGRQKYDFESIRDLLSIVYEGVDLHMPKAFIDKENSTSIAKLLNIIPKTSQPSAASKDKANSKEGDIVIQKNNDDGFILSCDYFIIRRQSPKIDPARLLAWQEAGKKYVQPTNVRGQPEKRNESDEHEQSDPSDDDGYSVIIDDNCRRVFVYCLKILWNIENRDAVCSWIACLAKAAAPSKPSPSRQYARRKLLEKTKQHDVSTNANQQDQGAENQQNNGAKTHQDAVGVVESNKESEAETHHDAAIGTKTNKDDRVQENHQEEISKCPPASNISDSSSFQTTETSGSLPKPPDLTKVDNLTPAKKENTEDSTEGTRHFMVNVIEPQFNLHSEDANGRFLLAAVSGRVLAQSFQSVLQVGQEMIEQQLSTKELPTVVPEIAWKRTEMSVMLEHVQAHVAPTDVDLGAGVQWLPKILRGSPKVMRTGALLERVFMPCDMYFQYTRHKGCTNELKVKPLKEVKFNSHNITAIMTSRQFQVMMDVLSNLLFARIPKPQKSSLSLSVEDDDIVEEEAADEVVPDGIEEVELEKINLEVVERKQRLLIDDIGKLSLWCDNIGDQTLEKEDECWMIDGGIPLLIQELRKELVVAKKARKEAYASLRVALQKAAQLQLMEKEKKSKSPSHAMHLSLQINKVVWSMLIHGKSFAEVEINDMIYDFDRDFKDVGISHFTTKYFVFRNCLANAKSDTVLAAWNPPSEWGKKVMLRLDARQGQPKDGKAPFELFQVDIYPLKIHLTETMYTMMWGYFFPEEEQRDSQRRKEVWKVSATAGARRAKKGDTSSSAQADSTQASKAKNTKEEILADSSEDEAPKSKTKGSKPSDEKKPKKMMVFHEIKISQVELSVTYEGSRFAVSDLRLLMDQFHRVEFVGSWQRLFSRVKKHVIWGVLKSVTGMQVKKFKDKGQIQPSAASGPEIREKDNSSVKSDQSGFPRPADGAGDGFVTSIKGLFHTQKKKAKAFVNKTKKGEGEQEAQGSDVSENEAEASTFARQLTIVKAKKLIKRHTQKLQAKGHKASFSKESFPPASALQTSTSPQQVIDSLAYDSDSSSASEAYEALSELNKL
ncbi:hypothetical protein HN51_050763 [Arachis hypogaea]|uniref:protein KINKY POLLEN-like isoform X1 n=3 Tax=Arachis ipaensis TaxID=130454 RepID=UPI0007AF2A27|nr:protein KINKY POLLEN-like isoform X1 [Arachis ipaensis]XP_025666057.1 protein KINKY POLLEN isoform X1 [Arachis hypogaea]QHN92559.1 Protein KINKY POLLEN [Arachis hypogaea]